MYLGLNRQPLNELSGDEICWRLGAVEVRKNDAMFRLGYAHRVLPATRFLLESFTVDDLHGTAIALLSGGKPPLYFVGWVPMGRELDAMLWVDTLNATLRDTTGGSRGYNHQ